MLKLILGIAGTGKTSRLLAQMEKRAEEHRRSILLVPEQFSSSAEGMVCRRLGDAKSAFVEVLSFRTLAERVLRQSGGLHLRVLNDAARAVFVRRALDSLPGQLQAFGRQKRSAAFCGLCAQTLAELKTAGATPEAVEEIANEQDDAKLRELALIFAAYETQIAGAVLDPTDRLQLAARQAGNGYFTGKACFVDSFDGFTPPEYSLLAQGMQHGEEMTVALCCDGLHSAQELDVFAPVRRTAQQLQRLANKAGLGVKASEVLPEPLRPQAPALRALNLFLAYEEEPPELQGGALYATEAPDEWEEVKWAAAEMHRLALEGVPYSRMALVCRDVAVYEAAARRQLALYDIPFFIDAPTTIEYTAPVAFLRAALALVRAGLSSPAVLALLKTGLCGYGDAEIAALENYVYTWQPKAADWRQAFTQNPDGLLAPMDESAKQQLAAAEKLRGEVVPVLESFIRKSRGRAARDLSKNLYLLLDKFGAPQHLEETARRLAQMGDDDLAGQTRRAWDLAMELLDQMALMLGDDEVGAQEYDELFLILVRSQSFGQVAQSLECAVFTGADRMRLDEVDYCFVLGLCEGEFPMQVGYSGLLTHLDRDALVAGGIDMPGSFENRTLLEEMFFYRALCAPRKALYLSYPKRRGGEAKSPSAHFASVRTVFAPPALVLDELQLAATPRAAYDLLGSVYRGNTPLAASLYAALSDLRDEGVDSALRLLDDVDNPGDFAVADVETLARLLGREMTISATPAEQYYQCHFAYFMDRVLRVRPRRKAELSPLESGSFVHHILEQVLQKTKDRFAQCGDEELHTLGRRCAEEFIAENLPASTRRAAWQLEQITETTLRLLCFMRDAAAQSEFEIDAVELAIGTEEDGVPPLQVETDDGRRLRIVGKVDRVDMLAKDGKTYLCIVDYKTGDKRLALDEVYCGLNMQMMIYLDALCQPGNGRHAGATPAGVMYLMSDPAPASGRRGSEEVAYRMDGLFLDDDGVLHALDNAENGSYIPVRYTKTGAVDKRSPVADNATFDAIRAHVRQLLSQMASGVYAGSFAARPQVKGQQSPCRYCAYRAVCRHEDGTNEQPVQAPKDAFSPSPKPDGEEGTA